MNCMKINIISWFLAASPIILFLTLLMGMKWGGNRSGALVNTAIPCGRAMHSIGWGTQSEGTLRTIFKQLCTFLT